MSKCELTIKTIYFFAPIRPAAIPTTLSQRSFGEIIIIRIINLVYIPSHPVTKRSIQEFQGVETFSKQKNGIEKRREGGNGRRKREKTRNDDDKVRRRRSRAKVSWMI